MEALTSVKKETFGQILSCSQWDEESSRLIQLGRKGLFSSVTGKERVYSPGLKFQEEFLLHIRS